MDADIDTKVRIVIKRVTHEAHVSIDRLYSPVRTRNQELGMNELFDG